MGGRQDNGVLVLFWCSDYVDVCLQEGIQITDPNYYSTLSEEKLAAIFRSDSAGEIPLLKERLAVLHEAGKVLVDVNTIIISNQLY